MLPVVVDGLGLEWNIHRRCTSRGLLPSTAGAVHLTSFLSLAAEEGLRLASNLVPHELSRVQIRSSLP